MQLRNSCIERCNKYMSRFDKAKERILQLPKDYTYTEARYLLTQMGFLESNKGRTSGSRVKFYRLEDQRIILLHKPHPGDTMKLAALKELVNYLKRIGEL